MNNARRTTQRSIELMLGVSAWIALLPGAGYCAPGPSQQEAKITVVTGFGEVSPAIAQLIEAVSLGFPQPLVVETDQPFAHSLLATEELVLRHGTTLTLDVGVGEDSHDRYILVRRIRVVPGPGNAPVITWSRGFAPPFIPPPVGKADPGQNGDRDGADGRAGSDGLGGNSGFPGQSAPTFYLAVGDIVGGDVYFDLRGQDGGVGGDGETGGDGGNGASGAAAAVTLWGCKVSPGKGGRGGRGGHGGFGGPGGRGGNGGALILVASPDRLSHLASNIRAIVLAGSPGRGGREGQGGDGGLGGPGGAGFGLCSNGVSGQTGVAGSKGDPNKQLGPRGVDGTFLGVPVTDSVLTRMQLQ